MPAGGTPVRDPRSAGETAGADLVVTGRVVTMDARRTVLADGAVAIRDGDIAAVGERADVLARHPAARVIDRPGAIVIPGLIDTHTHMLQALVRGLVAGELPMILRLYVPAVSALTPAEAHTAATLCAAQLLSSGVTTVCEGAGASSPEQLAAVLDAVDAVGIRCNVTRGAPDQDFHHAALYTQVRERSWRRVRESEAERDLVVTEELLRRFPPKGRGRVTGGVCADPALGNVSARNLTPGLPNVSIQDLTPVLQIMSILKN